MDKQRTLDVLGPQEQRVTNLSTFGLVREIAAQAGLLVKKQVELARMEIKADARTEAKVAGGLGVAAVAAIIAVTMLFVTAALALSLVMPGWAAGLIVTGIVTIAAGIVAGLSWRRRVRQPLEHSRRELRHDVRFAKERFV